MTPGFVKPAALVCFATGILAAAPAAGVSVFGVGAFFAPQTELFRFDESGPMEQRWPAPETLFGVTVTSTGTSLLVGEFGGAIQEYDFSGQFIGEFADVSGTSGAIGQKLESDTSGRVYSSFSGAVGSPATSYRLANDGSISAEYSHPSLFFPRGIDAAANGDVHIVNSANVGVGDRVFVFDPDGSDLGNYPIPEVDNPSDLAIHEQSAMLYIGDEFGHAIHVYDISTGVPTFINTIAAPGRVIDVFVDQVSGRIFGAAYEGLTDDAGSFLRLFGFEVSPAGSVIALYEEDAAPRDQNMEGIVVVQEADDPDEDGIDRANDNCLAAFNPDQRDTDADGFGNACDADLNDDCIVNFDDVGVFRKVFLSNDPDADFDGNGTVAFPDMGLLRRSFGGPPGPSGIANICSEVRPAN